MSRVVIIEFPDVATARAFHASTDYAGSKAIRQSTATARLRIIPGLDPA